VLLKNSRKGVVCTFLATSFLIQSNLACFASDYQTAALAASPGAEAARTNIDYGEIPVAKDTLASAAHLQDALKNESTVGDTPDFGGDEIFDNKKSDGISDAAGDTAKADDSAAANAPASGANSAQSDSTSSNTSADARPFGWTNPMLGDKPILAQANDRLILRGDASASPSQAATQVDDLTKQILLKEIELQKYNLHYSLEVAKQGRWKGWRYGFMQEINNSLGLTGGIISLHNRGQALHNFKLVRLRPQEAANYIPMTGAIIGASAAAGEFGINTYHEIIARAHGFSPDSAVRKVTRLKDDIDALLEKRAALMRIEGSDPSLQGYLAVDDCEGRILKDVRDQALQEFERFHVGARKVLAFQQSQYCFDVAKNVTNALGYYYAYLSLQDRHRYWNGVGGVYFTVSGGLTMFGPILSRLAGKGYAEFTRMGMKDIRKEARESNIDKLAADLDSLETMCKQKDMHNPEVATAIAMQGTYDSHEKTFTDEIRSAQKKNNAAKLTATQNIGAGLFVGGLKTASGILFIVPGFNDNYNTKTDRAGNVTNHLLFVAAVLGTVGTSFSMLDTFRIQVMGEINRQKAKKAGKLPGQIAMTRLKELDQMEQRLKTQ